MRALGGARILRVLFFLRYTRILRVYYFNLNNDFFYLFVFRRMRKAPCGKAPCGKVTKQR